MSECNIILRQLDRKRKARMAAARKADSAKTVTGVEQLDHIAASAARDSAIPPNGPGSIKRKRNSEMNVYNHPNRQRARGLPAGVKLLTTLAVMSKVAQTEPVYSNPETESSPVTMFLV